MHFKCRYVNWGEIFSPPPRSTKFSTKNVFEDLLRVGRGAGAPPKVKAPVWGRRGRVAPKVKLTLPGGMRSSGPPSPHAMKLRDGRPTHEVKSRRPSRGGPNFQSFVKMTVITSIKTKCTEFSTPTAKLSYMGYLNDWGPHATSNRKASGFSTATHLLRGNSVEQKANADVDHGVGDRQDLVRSSLCPTKGAHKANKKPAAPASIDKYVKYVYKKKKLNVHLGAGAAMDSNCEARILRSHQPMKATEPAEPTTS